MPTKIWVLHAQENCGSQRFFHATEAGAKANAQSRETRKLRWTRINTAKGAREGTRYDVYPATLGD